MEVVPEKHAHFYLDVGDVDSQRHSSASTERMSSGSTFKRTASNLVRKSEESLHRWKEGDIIYSVDRETKHFTATTTLHGPKRIYYGKGIAWLLWAVWMAASSGLFIFQIYELVSNHVAHPVSSGVSFHLSDGLAFPAVTLCSFNPIRKSHVLDLNSTGQFPTKLLDYLLTTNIDVSTLYMNTNQTDLEEGESELMKYLNTNPSFDFNTFYKDSGFECSDLLKICSFGGRRFRCCDYVTSVQTDLGKCFRLDLSTSPAVWMHQQVTAGTGGGLQVIVHSHREEEYDSIANDTTSQFGQALENGVRYHIHSNNSVAHLSAEGISAAPGARVYSAIVASKYELLPENEWGNCRRDWPAGYNTTMTYTGSTCINLCRANYFSSVCGCVPSIYRLDSDLFPQSHSVPVCSPLQLYTCLEAKFDSDETQAENIKMPQCDECKLECSSWSYQSFNSYGEGLRNGAVNWIVNEVSDWPREEIAENVIAINVFFRELSFTQYEESKGSSVTDVLSAIGGNMGMCLGMSLITCMEIAIYILKVFWITISPRRKRYLIEKKRNEKDRKGKLERNVFSVQSDLASRGAEVTPELVQFCTVLMERYKRDRSQFFPGVPVDPLKEDGLKQFYNKY